MSFTKRKEMLENLDVLIALAEEKLRLLKDHKQGLIQHLDKLDSDDYT